MRVRVRVCERGRYRSGDNKREREREIGDIETDNQSDKKFWDKQTQRSEFFFEQPN